MYNGPFASCGVVTPFALCYSHYQQGNKNFSFFFIQTKKYFVVLAVTIEKSGSIRFLNVPLNFFTN